MDTVAIGKEEVTAAVAVYVRENYRPYIMIVPETIKDYLKSMHFIEASDGEILAALLVFAQRGVLRVSIVPDGTSFSFSFR